MALPSPLPESVSRLTRGAATSLGRRDLSAVLAIVAALADVRSLEHLRRDVVQILPTLVPTTLVSWNEIDVSDPMAEFQVVIEPDVLSTMEPHRQAALNAAFAAHIGDHPAIRYFQRTGDGQPRTISDFLSEEAFHATDLYQAFYGQPEIAAEDQLSLTLPQHDHVVGVALNRPRRDFSSRDRAVLNLLRPPIVQAYRNASALARLDKLLATLERAVDSDGEGLVLLNARGQVEHMTPRADELVRRYFDGKATPLPSALAGWALRSDPHPEPEWPLVTERGGLRLVVRRLPGPNRDGIALVLAERPAKGLSASLCGLGLTPRQAEVMLLVTEGGSTKEIARSLGLRPRTVDKHVEQALRTLGAPSRLAAANLIRQIELG